MAQVVPAEGDMRRVIGDGEAQPDGEVEGLADQDLLELYRAMVLLRTYDERSVVFHRQGRIGTYAIFWGHEAMQAGSFHALAREDWIFPSYRESAIGLLRGMPPETVAKINKEVRELFADPEFQKTFLDRYLFQSIAGSPEDLMSFVKSEEPKWRKIIQDAKIKVE